MRIDYNIKDKFDFGLFLPALILFGFGLLAIYSSTVNNTFAQDNFQRQVIWGIIAFIIFFITYSLPTNIFKSMAVPAYVISIFLLLAVLVMGKQISGSKSWLVIGAIGFQPSEIAKIGTIMAIAGYLSRSNSNIDSFKDILITLAIGFAPVMLILMEPDMGTSIVFMGMILVMFFWKGISSFSLFVVLSPALVAIAAIFGTIYFIAALLLVVALLITFKKNLFFSASIFATGLSSGLVYVVS